MNLPNKLTLLRFALVPVFMVFMYIEHPYSYLIALIVFAAASFTDFLDGSIARKYNMVTDFALLLRGEYLSPRLFWRLRHAYRKVFYHDKRQVAP